MSTFDGFVAASKQRQASAKHLTEFPHIRIDRFTHLPTAPPPLACFLSHVHTDHLLGLESLRSPFVYCSAATRQLLLRLKRSPYPIRKGQRPIYTHLKTLLRPLPFDTPTRIELTPQNVITVTLLEANHCPGAVMFLVQNATKSILYTGDVRSEPWWVHALARNPVMLPYARGLKILDCVYLDTTYARDTGKYRNFVSKADGIAELLHKVARHPDDALFYLHARTFGYEEVWLALSHALETHVHLDRYRFRLYDSLKEINGGSPALCGFMCGNVNHPGALTLSNAVRLHSCRNDCSSLRLSSNIVHIVPVVSRHANVDMLEPGSRDGIHGSGLVDPVASLEVSNNAIVEKSNTAKFEKPLGFSVDNGAHRVQTTELAPGSQVGGVSGNKLTLEQVDACLADLSVPSKQNLNEHKHMHSHMHGQGHGHGLSHTPDIASTITFPYSRHSSYNELRHLVLVLKPRDVFPCVAIPLHEWSESLSMKALFGDLCVNPLGPFMWDEGMKAKTKQISMRERRPRTGKRLSSPLSRGDCQHVSRKATCVGVSTSPNNNVAFNIDATHESTFLLAQELSSSELPLTSPSPSKSHSNRPSIVNHASRQALHHACEQSGLTQSHRSKDCTSDTHDVLDLPPQPPATIRDEPTPRLKREQKRKRNDRIVFRQDAFDAARRGNWDRIKLASTSVSMPTTPTPTSLLTPTITGSVSFVWE